MKIFVTCMECFKQFRKPSNVFEAEYFEELIIEVKCPAGHESKTLLQMQKFEVLLNAAAVALLDKYTLEAAFNFAVAYERFFEFAIRVLCAKSKIDNNSFQAAFKEVKKQSERQVGAFLFLYLIHFNEPYKLNQKISELRNKYIHQGYIPTYQEVLDFGEMIYDEIYNINQIFKKSLAQEVTQISSDDLQTKFSSIPSGTTIATMATGGLFSLTDSNPEKDFSKALAKHNDMIKCLKEVAALTSQQTT